MYLLNFKRDTKTTSRIRNIALVAWRDQRTPELFICLSSSHLVLESPAINNIFFGLRQTPFENNPYNVMWGPIPVNDVTVIGETFFASIAIEPFVSSSSWANCRGGFISRQYYQNELL